MRRTFPPFQQRHNIIAAAYNNVLSTLCGSTSWKEQKEAGEGRPETSELNRTGGLPCLADRVDCDVMFQLEDDRRGCRSGCRDPTQQRKRLC
jgi:hypothetical protein